MTGGGGGIAMTTFTFSGQAVGGGYRGGAEGGCSGVGGEGQGRGGGGMGG